MTVLEGSFCQELLLSIQVYLAGTAASSAGNSDIGTCTDLLGIDEVPVQEALSQTMRGTGDVPGVCPDQPQAKQAQRLRVLGLVQDSAAGPLVKVESVCILNDG